MLERNLMSTPPRRKAQPKAEKAFRDKIRVWLSVVWILIDKHDLCNCSCYSLLCVYIFVPLCKLTYNGAIHSYSIFSESFNKILPSHHSSAYSWRDLMLTGRVSSTLGFRTYIYVWFWNQEKEITGWYSLLKQSFSSGYDYLNFDHPRKFYVMTQAISKCFHFLFKESI